MIYQLKYTDKTQAIEHIKQVGVLDDEGNYTNKTHAVVHIGLIEDVEGEYDIEGNEITSPTYLDGYHVDVMTKQEIDFGSYVVIPITPKHQFA